MSLRHPSSVSGLLVSVLLLAPSLAQAQTGLQSPTAFLGYELGSHFTPHHRVVDYVEHVAAASPNVQLQPYGETNEGRPLMVAFIATPDNLSRLEQIRTDNLRLAGLEDGATTDSTPAIVWLSYNVHGNESVSTEAALQTLYDLADPANARTQAWLQNTVVIIDPCINPDGRDRYVHWYNRMVGETMNPNPAAREHSEPWPGGRTNHYYFDLNRDWSWMTQKETQQRLVLYNRWMPHIHVDFHEQGVDSPYYFAPAAEPFHERITGWQRTLQTMIGQNHTRYFDQNNWLYFTREVFDLFYPGYGDTWPTFNGSVGMTYEQGGSGRAGLGIITAEGDTLTLRDRIDHHYTTGLSTIETASANQARIVSEFQQYFGRMQTDPPTTYKTYVVKDGGRPGKLSALASHLTGQGITFGYAASSRTTQGYHYSDRSTGSVSIDPGDLIVNVYQPKGVLVDVLFEPEARLADSLSYDITAWALPYVYGLDTYALSSRLDPDTPTRPGQTTAPADLERPYAYLAEWESFEDLQFLAAVLKAGIKLRFAQEPFEIEGRRYDEGALILTRTGNEAMGTRFDAAIREAAALLSQPIHAVSTGYVTSGSDFGSGNVSPLQPLEVAMLSGEGVSSSSVGEVWHFFDQQLGYPLTLIHTDDIGGVNWHEFDVLILPNGSYNGLLPEERLSDLRAWVRAGGRLIALEGAAEFLAGKDGFALKRKEDAEEGEEQEDDPEEHLRTYAARDRESISGAVTGAVFRVQVDSTHPLGFGYDETYYTLKRGSDAFAFLEDHWNVGVLREDAHVSGFAGAEAKEELVDTLAFGVQDMGRGAVVYFIDDPLFRAFWYNGRLLFGNAVFLVGQ